MRYMSPRFNLLPNISAACFTKCVTRGRKAPNWTTVSWNVRAALKVSRVDRLGSKPAQMYLLPGRRVPAQDHGAGAGSAREDPRELRARTSVADLLEVHQRFVHVPAPPHGELHVPAQETTGQKRLFLPNILTQRSKQKHSGGVAELCECRGVRLEARTLPASPSPRSEALSSGCRSHKTWSTETERRQEGHFY